MLKRTLSQYRSASLAFAVVLASCSAGSTSTKLLTASDSGTTSGGQTLYASSEFGIVAYDTSTLNVVRTYTNQQGLTIADEMTTDSAGDLFVSNQEPDAVFEFAAGTTRLVRRLAQPYTPGALAIDREDDLYVADSAPARNLNEIAVYSPKGKLLRTITDGVDGPSQMVFDSRDALYVANLGGPVTIYNSGQSKPARTIGSAVNNGSLAVDASDDIYVGTCLFHCSPSSVVEYGPQGHKVLRTIKDGIRYPGSIALDPSGNLFVADGSLHKPRNCYVTAYASGATHPFETITDGVSAAGGVAFDAAGNLYIANGGAWCRGPKYGSVTVYPPGQTTYANELTQDIRRLYSVTIGP
jgi:sugar lactone lactonase YvrE